MKVSVRLSFTIISLALFFNVLAVTGVKAQIINEILKRMESHQKALSSLRAKVTMRKYNPQLNESDVSNGTAIYVRGYGKNLLTRIDWVKPTEETLSVVNNQYVFYRPRLKQAIVGKLNKAKENGNINNLFSFLSMSKKEIRENFDLEYLGRDKVDVESQTWHLKFTPKKTAVFKPAEFWVDGNGMPIQARVFEENNDSTTVLLSDFSKNIAINTSAFVLNLPRETKILSDRSSLRPSACFKPAPGDALKNWSDTVFSGRVTAAKGGDYTVKAERIWKGIVVREMVVKTMSPENKYAVRLMIGHQYIVFARNVIVEGKTISGLLPCSLTSDIFSDIGKKILKEIGIGKPLKKAFNKKKRRNFIENIRKRH